MTCPMSAILEITRNDGMCPYAAGPTTTAAMNVDMLASNLKPLS